MGGEKDKKKPFRQNPFKDLKGFCASAPPEEKPAKDSPAASPPEAVDEDDLFATEMIRLGVRSREAGGPDGSEAKTPVTGAAPARTETEEEIFLSALGRMEVTFEDEVLPEAEKRSTPRRMKEVRQGKRLPEAKVDLHGLSRIEAREKVRYFLEDSVYQGKKTVIIVTGRGKGSAGEPVLRAEIEGYLSQEATSWVSEWGRAPARFGGEGALVVFLKNRKTKK